MIIRRWGARHPVRASDTSVTYRRTTSFRLEHDGLGACLLNVIDGPSRSGADYRSLPIQFRASMNQRTHEESACNSRTARRSVYDTSTHTARRIERPHARTTGAGSTGSGTPNPAMDQFTIRIPILWWINSSSGSGTANPVPHRSLVCTRLFNWGWRSSARSQDSVLIGFACSPSSR